MFNKLLSQKKDTATMIAEIHDTFYNAGDKLLAEANELLDSKSLAAESKINRLVRAGFKKSVEVKRWDDVKVTKSLADLVNYYKQNYPLNKFITEEQVFKICKKYKLICAPVERYSGFVPDSKLQQIESFNLKQGDKKPDLIRIKKAWDTGIFLDSLYEGFGALNIHRIIGMRYIPADDKRLMWRGKEIYKVRLNSGQAYVEKYGVYSTSELMICAPSKEMNLKGLKRVGATLSSLTTVTVPDPVVLQPVKGGFLILAAWGEEASDEIIVNPIQN